MQAMSPTAGGSPQQPESRAQAPHRQRAVLDRFRAGVTRYQPSDRADLASFRREAFGDSSRQADDARHRWVYEENPFNDEDGPGIWVCRRDGKIVGQQAEIPFVLQVGRDERRATWAVDLMVEQAWRLRGVGPALMAAQRDGKAIVGGLNLSKQGAAAYKRAGWTDLGTVPVYVRPLDANRALRKDPVPGALRRLARMVDPIWRVANRGWRLEARAQRFKLVPTDRLDERSDAVWNATADCYAVLARRDLEALAWRIDQRPDRDKLERYYLLRRGRPVGYVVLRYTDWDGDPAVAVVDYLVPPQWVGKLFVLAGRAARRRGAVAMLAKTRNEPADRYLRSIGFLRRQQANDPPVQFMVHCDDEPGICALVQAPECWFVTAADSDLEPATV